MFRLREGVYIDPGLPIAERTAILHGGVLACVSVARHFGLWVLPHDGIVHVSLHPHGHVRTHDRCSCVSHWEDVQPGATRVSLIDALLQIRGCLGDEAFFVTLESALRKRVLSERGRRRLREKITESARWLVEFARSDADSGLESLLRLRLHRLGLTLATQVWIPGVGRVDFVLGDRLIIEVDGRPGHEGDDRHKDLMRDVIAAAHGFDTLRFDYEMVINDWTVVEDAILAKVAAGLHLSPWAERVRRG